MATTQWAVNSPLAQKAWAKKAFTETLKKTYFGRFIGSSATSLIQRKDELSKNPGDQITIGLRMQMIGDGVAGDNTLEGNEEALVYYDFAVLVDQLRNATRSAGKMSEQRVPFEMRQEGMDALTDWFAGRYDLCLANQLTGNTVETDRKKTGNNSVTAATNIVRAGAQANDESLGSSHKFDLSLIDAVVERAMTLTPVINPIKVNGEDKYVMFLHPYQVTDLRTNTSTGQWLDIQKAAAAGGQTSNNPIFTGALGEYNGVILHSWTRLPQGINSSTGAAVSNTRRAVLCGAQSAVIAFAQGSMVDKMDWKEEMFDYQNQLGIAAGSIFGIKKTVFNNADFATIVVPTYAASH